MYPTLEKNIKMQLGNYKRQLSNLKKRFILKSIEEFEFNQEKARLNSLINEYELGLAKLNKNEPELISLDDLSDDGFINAFY